MAQIWIFFWKILNISDMLLNIYDVSEFNYFTIKTTNMLFSNKKKLRTPCKRPKGKSRRERINIKKNPIKRFQRKKLTGKKRLITRRKKRFEKTFVNLFL